MSFKSQAELNLGSFEQRSHFWYHHVQIGTNPESGDSYIVTNQSRQAATYLDGLSGAGKSSLMENLAVQDITVGHSVIFEDPHGDSVDHIIAQVPLQYMNRIHLLNVADTHWPFGLNLLHMDSDDPLARTRVCDRLMHCFSVLWGDIGGQIYLPLHLHNAALALTYNPGSTLLDMERFLRDTNYRRLCLNNVQDHSVKQHWQWLESLSRAEQEKQLLPIQHRLGLLFSGRPIIRNIVGQSQTTIDFRKAIENRETILIKLPVQTLPYDARLIGTLLNAAMHEAVFSYGDVPEAQRPGFSLYVDEVQSFTSPDFATMLTQARKYGARVTIANQMMSQLPQFLQDAVKGAHTKVCFRLTHEDARLLAPYYVTGEIVVRKIDSRPVEWLMHNPVEDKSVRTFVHGYLLPVQAQRKSGQVEVYRPNKYEPHKEIIREEDPIPYLNNLLVEVMQTGDPTLQIRSEIVLGFSGIGHSYRTRFNWSLKNRLLTANITFPKHLVVNGSWTRDPEDSREQLLHFLFHLRATMSYLAANPVGEKRLVDGGDIAPMLTQLPKRAAFVRSGDDVGVIYTDDTLPSCDEDEFEARITQVKVQTMQKYCYQAITPNSVQLNPQPLAPQFRRFTEVQ